MRSMITALGVQSGRALAWLLLGLGALVMLLPFYFMFVFATHAKADIFSLPLPWWFGSHLSENLAILLGKIPFWKNLGWSLYVAGLNTALTLVFCTMGGYAFAMFEFKGKSILFAIVMGTLLIPSFLSMIPSFMMMDFLGWIDQHRALYVPGAANAFGIFLMRQYIASTLSPVLLEAARMDGCSEGRILFQIVMPILKPAMATLGLVTFIASWNNFMGPLIILRSPENYTLPLALRSLQNPIDTEWGAVMLGAAIGTLPLLLAFVMTSRRLIDGLTAGAVK